MPPGASDADDDSLSDLAYFMSLILGRPRLSRRYRVGLVPKDLAPRVGDYLRRVQKSEEAQLVRGARIVGVSLFAFVAASVLGFVLWFFRDTATVPLVVSLASSLFSFVLATRALDRHLTEVVESDIARRAAKALEAVVASRGPLDAERRARTLEKLSGIETALVRHLPGALCQGSERELDAVRLHCFRAARHVHRLMEHAALPSQESRGILEKELKHLVDVALDGRWGELIEEPGEPAPTLRARGVSILTALAVGAAPLAIAQALPAEGPLGPLRTLLQGVGGTFFLFKLLLALDPSLRETIASYREFKGVLPSTGKDGS
jgi:hypothetical protein